MFAFSDYNKVDFFVVESDSSDNTVQVLEGLATTYHNFSYTSLGKLSNTLSLRSDRIAYCRNTYMEYFENFTKENKVEYLVVADLDGVNSILNVNAIRSINVRTDWEGCTANQTGGYYDIWALRHEFWSPNDCWLAERSLINLGMNRFKAQEAAVYGRMIRIPPNSNWIPVDSAFGGLAIYKSDAVVGLRYAGLTATGTEICEHVSFNFEFKRRGGRLLINPKMLNDSWNEHNEAMKQRKIIKRNLKRIFSNNLDLVRRKLYA
jgi:hypothetical protein